LKNTRVFPIHQVISIPMSSSAKSNVWFPDDIFAARKNYKASKERIFKFLVEGSLASYTRNSTPNFLDMAKQVVRRNVQRTQQVREAFDIAIHNRRTVTQYYKYYLDETDEDRACTKRHENFITVLIETQNILKRGERNVVQAYPPPRTPHNAVARRHPNRFWSMRSPTPPKSWKR
jgi:hypothetical protein